MTDIIKELYKERFYTHWQATPEYLTLAEKDDALWERVRPLLGSSIIEQIQDSQSDINYLTNYEWFREGFLLGANLMLELL